MPQNDHCYWPRPEEDHHILGEVRNLKIGRKEVKALVLYELSVGRGMDPDENTPIRGKVVGSMKAIRCTICGRVHDWIVDQRTVTAMIDQALPVLVNGGEHA